MKLSVKHIASYVLAISLLCCSVQATSSFPDVDEDADYAEVAEYLNDIGVMQGDTQGNFNPDKNVTRAQMAALLCRLIGETENLTTDGSCFSDVPATYWANSSIIKAASLGIISGYNDGTFRPNNTVTYEQALTMIVRAMGRNDEAIAAGGYPRGYIEIACEYGYTTWLSVEQGDLLTRWQVAMILYNTLV